MKRNIGEDGEKYMVFVNQSWNGTGNIIVYSNYHKYWLDKSVKSKIRYLMYLVVRFWT